MLELSIAVVVIAAVAWDAFRRYLAVVKWNNKIFEKIQALDRRIDQTWSAQVDVKNEVMERLEAMEKKVNQTATDLGAISITDMNRRGR